MWDVADILFLLRRCLSHCNSTAVEPAYWVNNIEVVAAEKGLSPAARIRKLHLLAQYPLEAYLLPHWHWVRLESYYVLDQLAALRLEAPPTVTNPDPEARLLWVDVGSKNGGYFPALCAVAKTLNPAFNLVGIELDAYRYYEDGATRAGYGRGMAQALHPNVRYEVADFCEWQPLFCDGQAQVVSCFLPFLHLHTHKTWGLTQRSFKPLKHLNAMWNALAPGGLLVLSNQNAHEAQMQKELIQRFVAEKPDASVHPILEVEAICHQTEFLNTREDTRYLWKLRKPAHVF